MDVFHVDIDQFDVLKRGVVSALALVFSVFFFTTFALFLIHILQGGLFVKVYKKSATVSQDTSYEFAQQNSNSDSQIQNSGNITNTNTRQNNINNTNVTYQTYSSLNQNTAHTSYAQTAPVLPKRIKIPSLSKSLPVLNPKSSNMQILDEQLLHGTVRYPNTATPDMSRGNMLIFGHSSHLPVVRNKMFKAFNDIEKLKKGEKIIIEGDNGKEYVYETRYVKKVSADNSSVLIDTDNKQLTLITCENFGSKQDRWVLVADFAEER